MIVDANVLLYAEDDTSPFHAAARDWLTQALNGYTRVGLPWASLLAFVRIRTNPRIFANPLSGGAAWEQVESWLHAPAAWLVQPTEDHPYVLGGLVERYHLGGKAIPDAHLAAMAIEHGVAVCSFDSDFARFTELRWINPGA